ncbi:MAG TPA: molybdopterin-guanine dinucleotide biosynthesis protein B [Thermoanaerobaculia bacterium]|nr:molybdopterin-guanine dinucleotide biosynthesis protein B [Thermoanaerobaculia bacterium]
MHAVAIVGGSGSGKTTLITRLIRRFTAKGLRVAAIKHTHHALNEERQGDTAAFEQEGAEPVILAADGEAVRYSAGLPPERFRFREPRDLLSTLDVDLVLIEGFKSYAGWPVLHTPIGEEEAAAFVDRIRSS